MLFLFLCVVILFNSELTYHSLVTANKGPASLQSVSEMVNIPAVSVTEFMNIVAVSTTPLLYDAGVSSTISSAQILLFPEPVTTSAVSATQLINIASTSTSPPAHSTRGNSAIDLQSMASLSSQVYHPLLITEMSPASLHSVSETVNILAISVTEFMNTAAASNTLPTHDVGVISTIISVPTLLLPEPVTTSAVSATQQINIASTSTSPPTHSTRGKSAVDLQSMLSLSSQVYHPLVTTEMIVSSPSSPVSPLRTASFLSSASLTHTVSEAATTLPESVTKFRSTAAASNTPPPHDAGVSMNNASLYAGVGVACALLVLSTTVGIIITVLVCLKKKKKLSFWDNLTYQNRTSEMKLSSIADGTVTSDHSSTSLDQKCM